MKGVCHRFLPIDRYNRYQTNQITDFYRLTTPGILQRTQTYNHSTTTTY